MSYGTDPLRPSMRLPNTLSRLPSANSRSADTTLPGDCLRGMRDGSRVGANSRSADTMLPVFLQGIKNGTRALLHNSDFRKETLDFVRKQAGPAPGFGCLPCFRSPIAAEFWSYAPMLTAAAGTMRLSTLSSNPCLSCMVRDSYLTLARLSEMLRHADYLPRNLLILLSLHWYISSLRDSYGVLAVSMCHAMAIILCAATTIPSACLSACLLRADSQTVLIREHVALQCLPPRIRPG